MKPKLLFTILIALCLSLCLVFTSCDNDETADSTNSSKNSTTNSSEKHMHNYLNWTETKEPTCLEKGEKTGTCSCGKVATKELEATGHTYEEKYCVSCGEREPSAGLVYNLSFDKTYYTVAGSEDCIDTDIYIPSTYEGKPVKGIEDGAFMYYRDLTSITIPDSVVSIGVAAFENCINLTEIKIPSGVSVIENRTFDECTSLTNIVIPEGVTHIGSAFSGCTGLKSITIPKSVESIGVIAFSRCENLEAVYITDIAAWCGIRHEFADSNPLYYAEKLYLNGELVTDLVIPEGVTEIKDRAFYNCQKLTSVTIPDSVTSIGSSAFENCTSLTRVTISDSVTSIDEYAFSDCSSLTSVIIPDSVTSIDGFAFSDCTGLTIYCEVQSQPNGWSKYWNGSDCPVVWGYKAEE